MKASELVRQLEEKIQKQEKKIRELTNRLEHALTYPEIRQEFKASDNSKILAIWYLSRTYEKTDLKINEVSAKLDLQVIAEKPERTNEAEDKAKELKEKFELILV